MATHKHPESGENLLEYLASNNQLFSAKIARELILCYPSLEVRDIQYPQKSAYTCWYASPVNYPKLPVLNFSLYPSSIFNLEFRFIQYVPSKIRDKLQWINDSWVYARVSESSFKPNQLRPILDQYVPKVVVAAQNNILKRGGTSAAETIIDELLQQISPNSYIQGERPDWLRSKTSMPLQLDFYSESDNVAIEVQGPHHSKDLFNKPEQLNRRVTNDIFKVENCLSKKITIIWMDSFGIQRELARLKSDEQIKLIRNLLVVAKKYRPCFVKWSSPQSKSEVKIKDGAIIFI